MRLCHYTLASMSAWALMSAVGLAQNNPQPNLQNPPPQPQPQANQNQQQDQQRQQNQQQNQQPQQNQNPNQQPQQNQQQNQQTQPQNQQTQNQQRQSQQTQQSQTQQRVGNAQSMRGRVVRTEGNDRVLIRTNDNRDVWWYVNPNTTYSVNGRTVRFTDLQPGTDLNAYYTMDNDRYIVSQIYTGDAPAPVANNATQTVRGRVTKAMQNDQFVVRTNDNRDVVLYSRPDTQVTVAGRAARVQDVQVGSDITAQVVERDNQWWVTSLTVENAANVPPNANSTADVNQIQGTIVRVVGTDQVIVKTQDGKEVNVYVAPQTTYSFDNQPGRFTDLQPGGQIRIQTENRDRRLIGRAIFGPRRDR